MEILYDAFRTHARLLQKNGLTKVTENGIGVGIQYASRVIDHLCGLNKVWQGHVFITMPSDEFLKEYIVEVSKLKRDRGDVKYPD